MFQHNCSLFMFHKVSNLPSLRVKTHYPGAHAWLWIHLACLFEEPQTFKLFLKHVLLLLLRQRSHVVSVLFFFNIQETLFCPQLHEMKNMYRNYSSLSQTFNYLWMLLVFSHVPSSGTEYHINYSFISTWMHAKSHIEASPLLSN